MKIYDDPQNTGFRLRPASHYEKLFRAALESYPEEQDGVSLWAVIEHRIQNPYTPKQWRKKEGELWNPGHRRFDFTICGAVPENDNWLKACEYDPVTYVSTEMDPDCTHRGLEQRDFDYLKDQSVDWDVFRFDQRRLIHEIDECVKDAVTRLVLRHKRKLRMAEKISGLFRIWSETSDEQRNALDAIDRLLRYFACFVSITESLDHKIHRTPEQIKEFSSSVARSAPSPEKLSQVMKATGVFLEYGPWNSLMQCCRKQLVLTEPVPTKGLEN